MPSTEKKLKATSAKTMKEFDENLNDTLTKVITPVVVRFVVTGILFVTYLVFSFAIIKWFLYISAFLLILSLITFGLTFANLKMTKKRLLEEEDEPELPPHLDSDSDWTDF